MIITVKQLEVRNWLSHREESIQFPETGVFLFWGSSGSGKSSLLEAIAFALAGPGATRAKNMSELHHELYPDQDMQVRLTLSTGDGGEIVIFRGTKEGRSTAWLQETDGSLVEGVKPVGVRVASLLGGMDGPTLFSTYYSQQGELDALIRMPGNERRKFIQRMLGVSQLDGVIRQAAKTASTANETIRIIDTTLPDEDLPTKRKNLQAALEAAQGSVAEIGVELEALEILGKQAKADLEASKQQWDQYQTLRPQLTSLQDTVLPSRIAERERIEAKLAAIAEAKLRLTQSRSEEIDALNREAEELAGAEGALQNVDAKRTEEQQLLTAADNADAALAALQAPEAGEDVAALQAEHASLLAEIDHKTTELQSLPDELGDVCYACLRPFDQTAKEHVHASIESRRAELQELIANAQTSAQSHSRRLQTAQAIHSALEQYNTQLLLLQEQQRVARARAVEATAAVAVATSAASAVDGERLKAVRSQLQAFAHEAARIEQDRAAVSEEAAVQEQLVTVTKQIDDDTKQIEYITAELQKTAIDPELRTELEKKYEQTREQYIALTKQSSEANIIVERSRADLENTEVAIARLATMKEEKAAAEAAALQYRLLETSVKEFRQYLVGTIRPMLEDLTSQHLSELTDGAMPAVSIDEEYNISVKRHGEYRRIGLCSGGEQARAAFCLRLALTQLVSQRTDTPIGFMVFDEIFGSQDEDHRKAILDALLHLRGVYPQTFLISHEDSIKDSPIVTKVFSVPNAESANRIIEETR